MALIESFSGIRGIYGKELTLPVALRYAYSYSKFLKEKKEDIRVVIGLDTRTSGEALKQALIEGLNCNVIDIGILPTAAVEHSVRHFKADGGIIITASHNEPEYNGFKFLSRDGAVLRPHEMQRVIDGFHKLEKLEEDDFLDILYDEHKDDKLRIVDKRHDDAQEEYVRFVMKFFNASDLDMMKKAQLKAVIDPNGGTGTVAKNIFERIGFSFEYVNMEISKFVRTIEPKEDSLKYLQKDLKKHNAEFAAGFDCDADRVEVLLSNGKLVLGNHLLAIISDEILSEIKHPEKQTVVVNDATSYLVRDIISHHHAKWEEVEVGEINIVDSMINHESIVGGEGSNGGVIITPSKCRDGILTLLYLLKIIAKKKKPLHEIMGELPEYHYLKDKLVLKKDFTKSKEKVKNYYLEKGFTVQETGDETGGLKALKDDGWVWFRQSKTEGNALRIIADSPDEKTSVLLLAGAKKLLLKLS